MTSAPYGSLSARGRGVVLTEGSARPGRPDLVGAARPAAKRDEIGRESPSRSTRRSQAAGLASARPAVATSWCSGRPAIPQQAWINRVIGLPGDRVQVVGGLVHVNAKAFSATALNATENHDAPWRSVVETRETAPDGRSHDIYGGDPAATLRISVSMSFLLGPIS